MGKKMKAAVVTEYGAPSVLKLSKDMSVPKPGKNQVLIRVHACGVNPVETYIRAGTYGEKRSMPFILGTDAAGVVESVGEGVTHVKAGDRVFTTATESGAYAEFTVASEDSVHKLHDALDFTQGAAIGIPYFTAYRALVHKAHAKPGDTVLVHGASGGVGLATCQMARAMGLTVLGTAGTADGMKLILKNGAHQAFNHREKGYTDKIMRATEEKGVDVIVEMLSNANLNKDLQMVARGGRITVIGARGNVEISPVDTMSKECSIHGVLIFYAKPEEIKESASLFYTGMEAGWLRPVIGSKYKLEKAAQAHQDLIESPGAAGKVVLTM